VLVLTGWRVAALDGMTHAGAGMGCTVLFTTPVSVGRPCHVTLGGGPPIPELDFHVGAWP
jgi:hypothetical protein